MKFSFHLIGALFFIAGPLFAEGPRLEGSCGILGMLGKPSRVSSRQDSAVEIEIVLNPRLQSWLTTTDGTLKPVLNGISLNSLDLTYFKKYIQYGENTLWDSLPSSLQKNLINQVSRIRGQDFWTNRQIPGLKFKDYVYLPTSAPIELFGGVYSQNDRFPIGKYFEPVVEFQGEQDIGSLNMVEIKVRTNFPAGDTSYYARNLQELLTLNKHDQHVYAVTQLPRHMPGEKPSYYAAKLGEFYRRVNLLAELITIVEERQEVRPNYKDGRDQNGNSVRTFFFDSASPSLIASVGQYFFDVANGKNPILGRTAKMAWVGFRGSDFFDEPGLIGFEYRSVSAKSDKSRMRVVLNRIQEMLDKREFGLSESTLREWIDSMPNPENVGGALAGIWHNQSEENLISAAHPLVKEALRRNGFDLKLLSSQVESLGGAAKLLLFNWGYDPLFWSSGGALEQMIAQQVAFIDSLGYGGQTYLSRHRLAEFLQNSVLYRRVLDSFGLTVPTNLALKTKL